MEDWVKDCKYILMPARHPVKGFETEYAKAYATWRAAWQKYRSELGVKDKLWSDGFILTDEIGALFYKDECVGFSSFTFGDLASGTMPDQAWFGSWDKQSFNQLKAISPNAMICSQFTVNPKFAGKGHIVRWKEIVFLYTFMRFDNSLAGVMAGSLNLTRGMQNACGETFGATVLKDSHTFNYSGNEILAQLVAYERKNIQAMMERKNIVGLCDDLWSRLINLSDFPVHQNNIYPLKKAA
jgi:hypothetical protein